MQSNRVVAASILVSMLAVSAASAAPSKQPPESGKADDGRTRALFLEGEQRQREGRYPEAIIAYRRALKSDSNQPETLNNLGFCYKQMEQYDKAVAAYRQALALKPDFAEAHEYLGEAYVRMGKLDLARREYKTLLELDPAEAGQLKEKIDAAASL